MIHLVPSPSLSLQLWLRLVILDEPMEKEIEAKEFATVTVFPHHTLTLPCRILKILWYEFVRKLGSKLG